MRYSLGFGGRYVSPIGPVVIDIGFNPEPILEKEEPWVQLHLPSEICNFSFYCLRR